MIYPVIHSLTQTQSGPGLYIVVILSWPTAVLEFKKKQMFLNFRSLSYGAIGHVLGHELTHGFDTTGENIHVIKSVPHQWFVIGHSHLLCRWILMYQKKEHIHFYRCQGESLIRTESWLRSELDGVSLPSRCFKRKQSVWWSNFRNTKSSTNFMWVRNSTVVLSAPSQKYCDD